MKVKVTTRFGDVIEFERKEKKFEPLPGEEFLTTLVRIWYPVTFKRIKKLTARETSGKGE